MAGQEPPRVSTGESMGSATGKTKRYHLQALDHELKGLIGRGGGCENGETAPQKGAEHEDDNGQTLRYDHAMPPHMMALGGTETLGIEQPSFRAINTDYTPMAQNSISLKKDSPSSTPGDRETSSPIAHNSNSIDSPATRNNYGLEDTHTPNMPIPQAALVNASSELQTADLEISDHSDGGMPFEGQLRSNFYGPSNFPPNPHWNQHSTMSKFPQQHTTSDPWGYPNRVLTNASPEFQFAHMQSYQGNTRLVNSPNVNPYTVTNGYYSNPNDGNGLPGNVYPHNHNTHMLGGSSAHILHRPVSHGQQQFTQSAIIPPQNNNVQFDVARVGPQSLRHPNGDTRLGVPSTRGSYSPIVPKRRRLDSSGRTVTDEQKVQAVKNNQSMVLYEQQTFRSANSHETASPSSESLDGLQVGHGHNPQPSAFNVRFAGLEEARRSWQHSIDVSKSDLDESFPHTVDQQIYFVQHIMAALYGTAEAADNEPMIAQWVKQRERTGALEDEAWKILARCMDAHQQAEPLVRGGKPAKRYCHFRNRMEDILKSLMAAKTICKHLMAPHYIDSFVDDPVGSANRVNNNRKVNQGKKTAIERGRMAMQLLQVPNEEMATVPGMHSGALDPYIAEEEDPMSSPERLPKGRKAVGRKATRKRKADDSDGSDLSFRPSGRKAQATRKKRESKYPVIKSSSGAYVIRRKKSPKLSQSNFDSVLRSKANPSEWQPRQTTFATYDRSTGSLDGSPDIPMQLIGYNQSAFPTQNYIDPALNADQQDNSYSQEYQTRFQGSTIYQGEDPRRRRQDMNFAADSPNGDAILSSVENEDPPEGFMGLAPRRLRNRDGLGN